MKKELKSLPLVAPINPLKGHHSKAVLRATLSCKSSPPPFGVKRGCAAHLTVQITMICPPLRYGLSHLIALGAGRPTTPQCLVKRYSATGPFHGLFPSVRFRTAPKSRDKYQNNSSARWLEHLAA
jgi:hypothetical protein